MKNYQIEMEKIIKELDGNVPRLLLHSCCGPCSSYILEYLSEYFKIDILFYNPNIYPEDEYYFREKEQIELIEKMEVKNPIGFVYTDYITEEFYDIARGLENEREGGKRCAACFRLRLKEAAKIAKEKAYDYFTTSLSISPHKNSQLLNSIGAELAEEYGVNYLFSDFKKKGGFQRSTELTKEFNMYRQNYCGCVFSFKEAEEIKG